MPRRLSSRLDELERGQRGYAGPRLSTEVWVLVGEGQVRNETTGEVITSAELDLRARVFTLDLGDATPR